MAINRRGFVKAAAALPVAAVNGACAPDTTADPASASDARILAPSTLRAVAEIVLPSELGADQRERTVTGFEAWVAGYRPVVERDHGYGTAEIRYTGPDPAPGWKAHLEAWDLEARQRHGIAFDQLDRATRESFIRAQLRGERGLGDPAEARNPALALLSWWAATPAAADLCHGAAIGRETCRPLSQVAAPPRPVSGSSP